MISVRNSIDVKNTQSIFMLPKLQQAIQMLQMNNIELNEFVDAEVIKNPFLKKSNLLISNKYNNYFDNLTHKESIYEIIEKDLSLIFYNNKENLKTAFYILDNTNIDNGIIEKSIRQLSIETTKSESYIRSIIRCMQGVSAAGFFALDIKESIKIRLSRLGKLDEVSEKIIDNIEILVNKNIYSLSKKCCISVDEAVSKVVEISKSNIFYSFSDSEDVKIKIPDIIVSKVSENEWSIKLNEETLPRVLLDKKYEDFISCKIKNNEELTFFKNNISDAHWLLKSLLQRSKTILKVVGELFKRQKMFFLYGPEYLEPMTLKDISESIKMHESTVSRATANKYLLTKFGIFELKSFFTNYLNDDFNLHISTKIIKEKISKIIKKEDKDVPYSDEQIVNLLLKDGVNLARRTVSKYRVSLGIPSSPKRKKII